MSDWTINPWNIPMALAIGVFVLLIAYVSSIKSKSRSTKTLLAWLVVVTINVAAISLENIAANSGWTDAFWNEWMFHMIVGFAAPLGQVLWVWFAYLFGTILFETEQRRVMAFLFPLAIVLGVIEVFEPFGDWNELTAPIVFLTQLWGVVVLARKWWISRTLDRTVYSSGYLVFPAVFSIPLLAVPVQFLLELGGVVGVTIWWTSFFTLALPIFIGLLFLQYTPESSSLEAKYFAVAVLVIVIAVQVRVGGITLLSDSWQRYAEPPFTQSYVFSPNGASGYTARSIPARFYDAVGEVLDAADDTTIVRAAPFSVSIYGATSDSIFINSNGAISLALPTPLDSLGGTTQLHRMDVPSVGAFRVDMDPSEAGLWVYTSTPDSLVVTWRDVPLFWDESENGRWPVEKRLFNSQVVMRRDGTIILNRGELGVRPNRWETGMTAGLVDQLPSYMQDSSWRGKVGTISEGYLWPITISEGEMAWVAESNSLKRIRFSQAESKQILRFMGFMFLSILVLVPIYFRISIRSRLRNLMTGLDNVVSGNMDVQVPVNVRDEVGQMSDAFNSMTASLRTYSHQMEDLVEERTAELKATQAQLVEQEKLASLGSLTAGIAHEIKNPLNFVNNFAEVGGEMADELAEAIAAGNTEEATNILAELKANAEQITKHGRRADSIVKAMMQHARGGASDRESIVVNDFLEEYANLAWHGMRAKDDGFQVELKRDFGPAVGELAVMPQELGRVVLNLLNNAFDAVREIEGASVIISSRMEGGQVEISVSDNGPGIPDAIRQKIFEPFFTTKATGEGTGLGLSLSYDIVTKGHGGTMTVGTSKEGGASFIITPSESMNARDFQTKDVGELKTWLDTTINDGFEPTLAIIFSSLFDKTPEIGAYLDGRGIAVFGASSWGEFAREGIERGSTSILLLDLPRDSFYVRLDELQGGDEEAIAESVAVEAQERFEKPAMMVLISDLRTRGEAILETFERVLGDSAEVAGAGAGTTAVNEPSRVFTNDTISPRALLSLVIDGHRIRMITRAACGWQAVGAPRKITKSEGYWVHEIDGVPALDALLKYIGREDLDLDDPVQWEVEVNTLPLQLQRPHGDPIMRPALLYDKETRAVMCTGKMEEGAMIRFSIEPDDDVIDIVLEDFKQTKEDAGDIDAVVYFSCWGRYNSLGPAMNREIREAGKLFGVPMIGLLSSGEMARATGGKLEFNALTSCCVLLKEIEE